MEIHLLIFKEINDSYNIGIITNPMQVKPGQTNSNQVFYFLKRHTYIY